MLSDEGPYMLKNIMMQHQQSFQIKYLNIMIG